MIKKIAFVCCLFLTACATQQDHINLFPIEHYDQRISTWIKPSDLNYNKPLLTPQQQQKKLTNLYNHYYGSASPWDKNFINKILQQPIDFNLTTFSNKNKPKKEIGYGENFRAYSDSWMKSIAENINVKQFKNKRYQSQNRGIAVDNLNARVLPTEDVHFYHRTLAGQGYPFDNLQASALWAGTPVYILGETRDHAWSLVVTPDYYIAWVKSSGIARTNTIFINRWKKAAKIKLIAIIKTKTSIVDSTGQFRFLAYVGSIFPAENSHVLIPVANKKQQAEIHYTKLSPEQAVKIPYSPTPHHFANIMQSLLGRPYGWGGLYFYNDCSAELKSLFTPFGIWLPRNSSDQIDIGKKIDLTSRSPSERLNYLAQNGHAFFTLIYVGGHIMLYIGNYPTPMTYQNLWALSPRPGTKRAVIGQSVIFPLLLNYPEDSRLVSQADKKYFQIRYLDNI